MNERDLWAAVARELGSEIDERERRLGDVQEQVDEFIEHPELQQDLLGQLSKEIARAILRHRRDWGDPQATTGDAYWELLRDLDRAELELDGHPGIYAWEPFEVSLALGWSTWVESATRAQPRVSLTFDHRMSQRELMRQVRRIWPLLLKYDWIRQTRPLGDRAIALVRLVCLESADAVTWLERMRSWNEQHPENPYDDVRNLHRDFRRAEKQLTGDEYGLERFSNPASQLAARSHQAILERVRAGDRAAVDYYKRYESRAQRRQESERRMLEGGKKEGWK